MSIGNNTRLRGFISIKPTDGKQKASRIFSISVMAAPNCDTEAENLENDDMPTPPSVDDFSATFRARVKIATNEFRQTKDSKCNPKDFLSDSEYEWETFLVAYPAAAWALVEIQNFFRMLEKPYLSVQMDEETGEGYQCERREDEMSAPDRYFQIDAKQDNGRLEACKTLKYEGDITTSTWMMECCKLETAALSAEARAKLRHDLQNAMDLVVKPWPSAIQIAINEINRRFDDLDRQLSDVEELKSARRKEIKPRRGMSLIVFSPVY
ncbi:hypothetical protein K469DRAFT_114040 [Zopfia rhizophila CBS 207.26]|uniref:Uncharacterized protein n=1 Tax=Zopfia rhizophila CBS 207.26 TaxID=1314779 RepID=A0A6A6E8U4_9PEZI|nr:hypothetical protein K469DRAFT_114040 [Zopfia rhizophila CBS 207.26]